MIAKQDMNSVADLSIPAIPDVVRKVVGNGESLEVDALAKALLARQDTPGIAQMINELPAAPKSKQGAGEELEIDEVIARLSKLSKRSGALEDFALGFTEAVFLNGGAKPSRVNDETYAVLQDIGVQVTKLRDTAEKQQAPKSTNALKALRKLDQQLLDHVAENTNVKAADYVALNAQHEQIARAIRLEENALIGKVPASLQTTLQEDGLASAADAKKWGKYSVDHVGKLIKAGVLQQCTIPEVGKSVAFAGADLESSQFEATIPPRTREAISEQLFHEFKTKYSNRYEPLGTAETRESGVADLRDQLRLQGVAERAGVSVAHVELALKRLEKHGLVKVEDGGYRLSAQGEYAGIGLRAIRFMQRAQELDGSTTAEVSVERYLEAAKAVRESWQMPTYTLETKDGGCPWVHLLDELYAGNARIDTDVLKQVVSDIQKTDNALVIASNMLQGDPAVEPRASRTSIPPNATDGIDYRDYGNQIKLVKELLVSLGHPVLQLHGKAELETANLKADIQRERDHKAQRGMDRPDEDTVVAALSRMNEISLRAGRKYDAPRQAELLDFVANVVMPLELKLGRELMDSQEVREKAGLNMNELEIVRDIVGLLIRDETTESSTGREKAQSLYRDFLNLPETGDGYIFMLEQVMSPEMETLAAQEPVARGGAKIQLMTPDGKQGLSMLAMPEARFGISEATNPSDKLIGILKSRTLGGEELPDIVCAGATGQPFLAMTAGGTMIVTADTLQASSFDDTYSITESQDRHKRRRLVRGGESYPGSIAFSGGVHDGIKTDAYTVKLWNHKIQQVLDANKEAGLPSRYVDIYSTSDWQTGSPTAKPATWLRGLFWAVENDQKEILINGDVFQGQNYGRAPAEMQMTGIVGIEDQQAFVHALLNPVLDMIKNKRDADPGWEIPKFTILTGNHETNSQTGKGRQGIWFLQTVASQIESFYRGAFGSETAEAKVLYPKKFVDRMGVDVDYSHALFDFSKETGFRIAAQHYVGAGAKSSKMGPPITAAFNWARAMENEMRPVHGFLLGHWHTQSVTQADGVFHCIFGANADKSGFEWHLGYPTTVPANGRVRLYSDRPPELFFVTDPYLRTQEQQLNNVPEYSALIDKYGSLEGYVEHERQRHQKRDQKKYDFVAFKETTRAIHEFLEPHRRIS